MVWNGNGYPFTPLTSPRTSLDHTQIIFPTPWTHHQITLSTKQFHCLTKKKHLDYIMRPTPGSVVMVRLSTKSYSNKPDWINACKPNYRQISVLKSVVSHHSTHPIEIFSPLNSIYGHLLCIYLPKPPYTQSVAAVVKSRVKDLWNHAYYWNLAGTLLQLPGHFYVKHTYNCLHRGLLVTVPGSPLYCYFVSLSVDGNKAILHTTNWV